MSSAARQSSHLAVAPQKELFARAGALCEIVNRADGSMARTPQLLEFAREHNLKAITIADLVKYIQRQEGKALPTPA